MIFFENLYLGETIAPKIEQILKKVNNKEIVPNLYVIALASNPDNMLDLIPEWELMQKGYPNQTVKVIGVANGKEEAIELVTIIIEQSIQKTGSADVRAYLAERWEGQE